MLLVLLLIVLSQVPRSRYVHPQNVFQDSTAELQFDYLPLLYRAEMALSTSGCSPHSGSSCSLQGQLYIIKNIDCSNLPNVTTDFVTSQVNFVYMRPGSTMNFTVTSTAATQVWILPDYRYYEYIDNQKDFNCQHPPSGAHCFEASEYRNKSYLYSVTQPAYYYIRNYQSSITSISYNRVLFNVTAVLHLASSYKLSASQFTTISFRKLFSFEKTCVLLNIPSNPSYPSDIAVLVSNVARGEDVLVFPAVVLFICLVFFFIFICVHVHGHRNCIG